MKGLDLFIIITIIVAVLFMFYSGYEYGRQKTWVECSQVYEKKCSISDRMLKSLDMTK